MESPEGRLVAVSHFVRDQLLWLLVGTYLLAGFFPGAGLWAHELGLGEIAIFGTQVHLSLSMLLLALLLANAGMGVDPAALRRTLFRPGLLTAGLAGNMLLPIAVIFVVSRTMTFWHNPDEVQYILVGLALVGSMPIAGSSTAWAQNADGELSLSLGLVLFSTLLSPISTPIVLNIFSRMTWGEYSAGLRELAADGTGSFLFLCVLAPSAIGIAVRAAIGDARYVAIKPHLKLANVIVLLLLNYINASLALPRVFANPDGDFLAMSTTIVVAKCALAFAAGWAIARLFRADPPRRASIVFGIGMNNNGTGLVLASMTMPDHPLVLVPIILYNLVQHLIAGVVNRWLGRPPTPPEETAEAAREAEGPLSREPGRGRLAPEG